MKMAPSPVPAPSIERLANDLSTREAPDPFVEELAVWLATSARFRSYATTYRDKIRKKLRSATDPEALRDVRAELAAAHLLLTDRRMELAYEAYGSGVAGPDLTVTFRGSRTCNVEVTRLRRTPDATGVAGSLLAKLRQLPPSLPNVLLLAPTPPEPMRSMSTQPSACCVPGLTGRTKRSSHRMVSGTVEGSMSDSCDSMP